MLSVSAFAGSGEIQFENTDPVNPIEVVANPVIDDVDDVASCTITGTVTHTDAQGNTTTSQVNITIDVSCASLVKAYAKA